MERVISWSVAAVKTLPSLRDDMKYPGRHGNQSRKERQKRGQFDIIREAVRKHIDTLQAGRGMGHNLHAISAPLRHRDVAEEMKGN